MSELEHKNWTGRTDGQPWMQRSLVWMMRVLPLWILYAVMAFVIPFYMLFNRRGYLSTYHFGRERMGYTPLRAFWHVYCNHFRFGQVILDRFCAFSGKRFHYEIEGNDLYLEQVARPEGMLQVSAHIGNFEMAGYCLKIQGKKIYAIIFGGETATVSEHRKRLFYDHNIIPINVNPDLSHIFTMNAALANGDVVSMPADRLFGSSKFLRCTMFDTEVHIPVGAFALAVQKEVPMLSVFVMKEGYKKYRIYVDRITSDPALTTRQRMQAMAQSYCDHITSIIHRYPTQWFNYYEYFAV